MSSRQRWDRPRRKRGNDDGLHFGRVQAESSRSSEEVGIRGCYDRSGGMESVFTSSGGRIGRWMWTFPQQCRPDNLARPNMEESL